MSGRDLAWKFAGLAGTTQDNPFLQKYYDALMQRTFYEFPGTYWTTNALLADEAGESRAIARKTAPETAFRVSTSFCTSLPTPLWVVIWVGILLCCPTAHAFNLPVQHACKVPLDRRRRTAR